MQNLHSAPGCPCLAELRRAVIASLGSPAWLKLGSVQRSLASMIGFFRRPWAGLIALLSATAYGLPGYGIPQWIEIGSGEDEAEYLLDFNSLKRDGQRVGFSVSRIPKGESTSLAFFMWVDCQRWAYAPEGGSEWKLIAARTLGDAAAWFACSKSKPTSSVSVASTSGNDLSRAGTDGICTFLSKEGSDVVGDPCRINATSNGTMLRWSDGVFTKMRFEGDKVLVESPGSGDLQGVFLSRTPKRMAIQYQGGIIRWCWSAGCPKSR